MNARHFAGWACTLLGTIGFAAAALAKIVAPAMMAPVFTMFGLPTWTIPVVGCAELIGVALAYAPYPLRRAGAAILGVIALGAFAEHETHGQYGMGIAPLLLGILVAAGVALRSPHAPLRESSARA